MFQGVVKIHNLQTVRKINLAELLQAGRTIDEQNDFTGRAAAPALAFFAQEQAEVFRGAKAGDVSRRIMVPDGMAFFIPLVLGEDATQIGQASLGRTVSLFTFAPD